MSYVGTSKAKVRICKFRRRSDEYGHSKGGEVFERRCPEEVKGDCVVKFR